MSIAGFKSTNHPQQTGKRGAVDAVDDRGTHPEVFEPFNERFGGFTLDVAAAPHNAKCERFYTRQDDGLAMPWGEAMWQGPTCFMCDGTGRHAVSANDPIPGTPFTDGTRDRLTDLRCPACNGHGRQASGESPTAPERVWCNPPYSDLRAWVRKAWAEWTSDNPPELVVMLLLPANRVEQAWWQDNVEPFRDRPGSPLRVEFLRGRMRFVRPGWTPGPKGDRPPFGCCLLIWEAS